MEEVGLWRPLLSVKLQVSPYLLLDELWDGEQGWQIVSWEGFKCRMDVLVQASQRHQRCLRDTDNLPTYAPVLILFFSSFWASSSSNFAQRGAGPSSSPSTWEKRRAEEARLPCLGGDKSCLPGMVFLGAALWHFVEEKKHSCHRNSATVSVWIVTEHFQYMKKSYEEQWWLSYPEALTAKSMRNLKSKRKFLIIQKIPLILHWFNKY